MKTFYIKTLGCKVNQYDSQFIREQFLNRGFQEVGLEDKPDICIVNTCSVTNRAQAKGRNYINRFRREHPDATLVVTGCTVDYQPESIDGKADFMVPNQKKFSLIDYMEFQSSPVPPRGSPSATPGVELENFRIFGNRKKDLDCRGITHFTGRTRAFIKVQDGCNEFCSYCILPYVRGRSRSRDFDSVIEEVKRLVDNEHREIVLTGIHLGDYGKDNGKQKELVDLLERLEEVPGLIRIRLSSLEPQDITERLIERIAQSQKICRHLHIPLQSGDSAVLRRMNRRYGYREYRSLLNTIASRIPDISFTTDVMVGFPGEKDEQFLNSCRAVEEIGFVKVHVFPYSLRPGTAAVGLPNRISSRDVKNRVDTLQKIAQMTALKVKEKLVDSLQEVLIEKSGINSIGYTSGYIPTKIPSSTRGPKGFGAGVKDFIDTNTLVRVRITGIKGQYLTGEKN